MQTFEINERVKVNAPYYPDYLDREGIVVAIQNNGYRIVVEFDDNLMPKDGAFTPGELDKVS